jgi:glucose/arabinose dehydrogenase
MRLVLTLISCLAFAPAAGALDSSAGSLRVETMAAGLDEPWAIGFLPSGTVLITERDGRLQRLRDGTMHQVAGLPDVANQGQGGLLDLLVPDDFDENRRLYFTYAKRQGSGAGTAVAHATLNEDETHLTGWTDIFELAPGSRGGRHFGSRIVEGPDGYLYITIGDRGDMTSAQDLGNQNGTVIRITPEGGVPQDNPFTDTAGARPEIWSYGHRNAQAAAFDAEGRLWVVEHGARGGDEVNLVERGLNYGWPVISYGTHYSGEKIGVGTHKEGMEQPEYYWDPSMAPSGMMIYSGALWPEWQGDLFVGSLQFDYISRLSGSPMQEVEQLRSDETRRVRDVREGPDGALWFLSVIHGALYRAHPG